jgi:hypothetical protein
MTCGKLLFSVSEYSLQDIKPWGSLLVRIYVRRAEVAILFLKIHLGKCKHYST